MSHILPYISTSPVNPVTCTSINVTHDALITATPSLIQPGLSDSLDINCSFAHALGSDFSTVMSLILSKTSEDDDVYTELATINSAAKSNVDVKNSLGSQCLDNSTNTARHSSPTSGATPLKKCSGSTNVSASA